MLFLVQIYEYPALSRVSLIFADQLTDVHDSEVSDLLQNWII